MIKLSSIINETAKNILLPIFQGRSVHNRNSKFFSIDKEWARQFTQSGQEDEILIAKINVTTIYRHDPLPEATNAKQLGMIEKTAKKLGFPAFWVDEGVGQPPSVFVINMNAIRIIKHSSIKETLTEAFELPSEMNIQSEKLAKFIASLFLKDLRKEISNTKRKADYYIVKYHESYRLATQYRNEGKSLFGVIRDNEPTDWGEASLRIYSKNDVLPDVLLFMTNNYHMSNDGYMESIEDPQKIVILVSRDNFVEQFKQSTEELIDTVKHEIRHWYQSTEIIGLPKTKILGKDVDVAGFPLKLTNSGNNGTQRPHHMQDIEFKTNLHTYAFHIRRSLNRNVPKPEWKKEFNDIVSGGLIYGGNPMMNTIIDNLEDMMKKDKPRWRQFVKELYKLVFPND